MDDESEARGWEMIVLRGAREGVKVIAFSPDGRTLAVVCSGKVQLWDGLTAGRPPSAVLGHRDIWSVRFLPDGRELLLGGSGGRLLIQDLLTGEATEVFLEGYLPRGVYCDLTPDGRYIVAAHQLNIFSSWLSYRPVADPASPAWSGIMPRGVYSRPLFLAGGDRFVVFEGEQRYIKVYVTRDTRTGGVVAEAPDTGDGFHSPVLSPDRRLIAARRRSCLAVFRAEDMGAEPVKLQNDNPKEFTGLAFHPSGRFLAATSNDATVKLYDTATWAVAGAFTWGIGRLRSVAFSPDGMLAAAGGDTGKVVVWDVDL
jgi:WD40 repeat protein